MISREVTKQPIAVGIEHRPDLQPLTEAEVRFEIDMCIGCDRCMRACPIPLSSLVSIADLNRATISADVPSHVAQFIHECVMCGSCVPVCPVDNHRDLLMLSLKQRLGVPWDSQVDMNRLFHALPAGWNLLLLLGRLREQPMFRDAQLVLDNYLLHLVTTSKMLVLTPGTVLMQEGEFGRDIYLFLEGRFEVSSKGPDGQELPLAIMGRGEYLGERGMLTGQQYAATVRAQTPSVVLQVPEQVMQHVMELVPTVRNFFTHQHDIRSLEDILKRMALFQGVADPALHWLAEQTHIKRYDRDECLFSEETRGRPARESLHILLEGFVKVARKTRAGTGSAKSDERIVAYRQGGDYFAGGLDLLGDRRAVTVTAITRTRVAEVPRSALLSVFTHHPEIGQRFQERLSHYQQANAAAHSSVFEPLNIRQPESIQAQRSQGQPLGSTPLHTTTLAPTMIQMNPHSDAQARADLHSLVNDGVVEGTEVLIIDLDKCIHCNECEEACTRRHGHSRMNRKGMVVGNISIATACRQCQDPVCMLCSRAGIARLPSGEVYITESCIGCGICAERCPYDNISIITLEDEAAKRSQSAELGSQSTWQQFSTFFKRGNGKERGRKTLPMAMGVGSTQSGLLQSGAPLVPGPLDVHQPPVGLDAYSELRKKVAIKCDLCAGYNNQACVQACPTGAALRVQPTSFFGSTEEILQRRVH